MTVNSYRDLRVWQKAMDLVVASYQLTKQFPQSELYGLTSQIQRATVSIPANIAAPGRLSAPSVNGQRIIDGVGNALPARRTIGISESRANEPAAGTNGRSWPNAGWSDQEP